MHSLIENGLEDYLSGRSDHEFDLHLAGCLSCQQQLAAMRHVSSMLTSFKSDISPAPSLGFQARVMRRVSEQKPNGVWGVLTMDPGFTRKLAFGSLLSLAVLGGYLFSATEDSMAKADHTPEAVMASHDTNSPDQQKHLDGMFLTLATYHQ